MAIKSGPKTIARKHARNYTHKSAQKRLDEAVEPFNRQVENSLFIDSVEIDYYHIQLKTGVPCTCEKVAIQPKMIEEDESNLPPVIPSKTDSNDGFSAKFQDDEIFGDSIAEHIFNDDMDERNGKERRISVDGNDNTMLRELPDSDSTEFADGLMMGGGIDCGICYRTGHQPGYKAYGKQRFLLTNYQIEQSAGYFVNTTKQPHTMERTGDDKRGYVMFAITVPKYFKTMTASVRNNTLNLVSERLYRDDGKPLTKADLDQFRGHTMEFMVKAQTFTHVVMEFEMAVEPLRANISGEVAALDYERLVTIGDITVILPPSLAEVENGDILIIKKRNLALKVRDKERKITADRRRLEWSVSTRVLQPGEALRMIAQGFKIY